MKCTIRKSPMYIEQRPEQKRSNHKRCNKSMELKCGRSVQIEGCHADDADQKLGSLSSFKLTNIESKRKDDRMMQQSRP